MIIYIPEEITPEERKRLLKIKPVIHALIKFNGSLHDAAEWLGMSPRWIRHLVKYEQELSRYYWKNKHLIKAISEGYDVKSSKAYLYASNKEKERINDLLTSIIQNL